MKKNVAYSIYAFLGFLSCFFEFTIDSFIMVKRWGRCIFPYLGKNSTFFAKKKVSFLSFSFLKKGKSSTVNPRYNERFGRQKLPFVISKFVVSKIHVKGWGKLIIETKSKIKYFFWPKHRFG